MFAGAAGPLGGRNLANVHVSSALAERFHHFGISCGPGICRERQIQALEQLIQASPRVQDRGDERIDSGLILGAADRHVLPVDFVV
jgi:hypothetical protein